MRTGLRVLVSAAALAAAYVLTVAPHELVHALVAAAYGLDPVWHADRVLHAPGTAGQEALVAIAGPVYSLVSGGLALAGARRGRGPLISWFGVLGVAGFCGYLISGPFATRGDVADALRLAHVPAWVGWAGAVVGVAGLVGTARAAAVLLPRLAPASWRPRSAIALLGLLALPPGAAVVLAAGIPFGPPLVAQFATLALTLLVALVPAGLPAPGDRPVPRPRLLLGVLLVLGAVSWLVLRPGVPL